MKLERTKYAAFLKEKAVSPLEVKPSGITPLLKVLSLMKNIAETFFFKKVSLLIS